MTEQENVDTVRAIYDAFGRGDVTAVLDRLTDDVDWAADSDTEAAPWYGRRAGKQEVASFFQALADTVEVSEFTPLSFAAAANEVHTLVRFAFSARGNGRRAAMNLHHFWRLRDGKVEYYRGSEDSAQTAAILGDKPVAALA